MDQGLIWMRVIKLVIILALPLLIVWERRLRFGKAESGQRHFYPLPPVNQTKTLIGTYRYSGWLFLGQSLIIFGLIISLCLSVTAFIINNNNTDVTNPMQLAGLKKVGLILALGSLMAFLVIYLIKGLQRRKCYCEVYKEGLMFKRAKPDYSQEPASMFIPGDSMCWMGKWDREVQQRLNMSRTPFIKFVPLPYLPMFLPRWVVVYTDESYQYAVIFYPPKEMLEVIQQQYGNLINYSLFAVLQPNNS